jgi:hyperosmotically inducible protein
LINDLRHWPQVIRARALPQNWSGKHFVVETARFHTLAVATPSESMRTRRQIMACSSLRLEGGRIMAEIRETHTVVEEDYPPVVYERRGLSGGAIAALVIAGIIGAVLITLLILNTQQRNQEADLAMERARADAAQRAAAQPPTAQPPAAQPPVVVVQPPQTPVPAPMPSQAAPAATPSPSSTSNVSVEVDVTTKLLDDSDLRTHPIDVKVDNGTATLSGELPSEELKARAERVAMSVKGVRRVKNNIAVKSD